MRHPIEHAEIVEISPAVLHADVMFAKHNHHVLSDPGVRTFIDDGQSFLRTVPREYDVIISQPSNPWIAGVGGLFTVEPRTRGASAPIGYCMRTCLQRRASHSFCHA